MKNILLVEDDPEIVTLLGLHLKAPEFNLKAVGNGADAFEAACHTPFDMLILDIMLPEISGVDICRKLRETNISVPILMLTARAEETDKVLALEIGADDYMTKPFGVLELMARTKALLRRADQSNLLTPALLDAKTEISYKNLLIDKGSKKVMLNNNRIELTPKEFDLLYLLASNPGKSFSRMELLKMVWGYSITGYENTVTSHINRLRLKIETRVSYPQYIITAWGTGYRFGE